ncbi:unnamed protein product [Rhizopus stolonifer]
MTHNGDNQNSSSKRIPCPYDKSHTVFEKDLKIHLEKRCNSDQEAYLFLIHSISTVLYLFP